MEIKKLNYGWGVKLAVLLIICVQYTVTITSPILGTIMEAFPEHASMVKLLETIPTFAAVIISILLGPLMKVFYKKQLLLFGIALSFFQFIPAIVPGFWPLFICRTVAGFGIGFMYSFAASFAVDMFDEKGAADMLGLEKHPGRCHGHRLSAAVRSLRRGLRQLSALLHGRSDSGSHLPVHPVHDAQELPRGGLQSGTGKAAP